MISTAFLLREQGPAKSPLSMFKSLFSSGSCILHPESRSDRCRFWKASFFRINLRARRSFWNCSALSRVCPALLARSAGEIIRRPSRGWSARDVKKLLSEMLSKAISAAALASKTLSRVAPDNMEGSRAARSPTASIETGKSPRIEDRCLLTPVIISIE